MPLRNIPNVPLVALGVPVPDPSIWKQLFRKGKGVEVACIIPDLPVSEGEGLEGMLREVTRLPVERISEKTTDVSAGTIYLLSHDCELCCDESGIHAVRSGAWNDRPLDSFFRTLARALGSQAFAVLVGSPDGDGMQGIARVKECGGLTFLGISDGAGDPTDALPVEFDLAIPLGSLAESISSIVGNGNLSKEEEPTTSSEEDAHNLREILTLVRVRTGHDFACYKRPTVLRRIGRRMQVHEIGDMGMYCRLLRDQPEEVQRLLSDLLISVTNFFRDPDTFSYFEHEVIPRLFEGKDPKDCVRVWSCGCSSGEEPYSLAMLLMEYREQLPDPPRIQIFASDINQQAIRIAREGKYKPLITSEMSPERLNKYFQRKSDGSYQVIKELRDAILFAPHNVLHDPPFSHLDLVACRNLLIYLNRDTQRKVMELFSFALIPGRFLFLGSSEGTEGADSLFSTMDKKNRIFENSQPVKKPILQSALPSMRWEIGAAEPLGSGITSQLLEYHHHRLISRYAPPSVLINAEYEILHVCGNVSDFMQMPSGVPTKDIIKSVHPSLQFDLRAVLMTANRENREAEIRGGHFTDRGDHYVNILVRPLEIHGNAHFLVLFDALDAPRERPDTSVLAAISGDSAVEAVVRRLEEELQDTRERLHHTIEQGEVTTEELKASNEELQAINEELRSATEELETSKEELQSVNEELATLNFELKEKVEEISGSHSDLQNLMHSSDIGTVFLTRDLKIKRYTRRVEHLLNIIESDIGRPFDHITYKFDYSGLKEDAEAVLGTLQTIERVLKITSTGSDYLARLTPYRTLDDRIEGVVISFVDITELRRAVGIVDR